MSAGEFLSNKAGYDEVKYMFLNNPRLKHEGVGELADEIDEYHSKNSVSSLYELSRTNKTGRRKAFKYYQKNRELLSKREVEKLQKEYPLNPSTTRGHYSLLQEDVSDALPQAPVTASMTIDVFHEVIDDLPIVKPDVDNSEKGTVVMLEELVYLIQSIDWQAVQDSSTLQEVLLPINQQMMHAAHLAIPQQTNHY